MSSLQIHLLGPPHVRLDDEPLAFATAKSKALLIYLAVEGGMQSREKLATLFWPERDTGRGRANLRSTLNYLRDTLPRREDGRSPHLHVERNALGFNFGADYTLDLDAVEAALNAQEIELLQTAVDLCRGDFLEGFAVSGAPVFDEWATVQRERWRRRMGTLYDRLSQRQSERGELATAVDTTTRWLTHDPLNETAHQRLMRLYFAAGDRPAALQAYAACRQRLADEVGVEPSSETKALAKQIQKASVGTRPQKRGPGRQSEFPIPQFSQGPLVGRVAAFSTLVARLKEAGRGQPQIVTLVGEAGIGKTRLAEEFLAWAAAQGGDVLAGRGFETGRELPYQPLVEALRPRLEQVNAPEDLLSDVWLAELSRLLPEVRDRYPDLTPPPAGDQAAQTRLYEAITRLTLALAAQLSPSAPLVLFVDDWQWTDAASLDALAYAVQRWQTEATPVLLLLAARSEALHPLAETAPSLADWLAGRERRVPVTTITLEPITAADTRLFVAAFAGETDTVDALSQWLFRETAGHPFYLVETLNGLLEQSLLSATPAGEETWRLHVDTPIPPAPDTRPGNEAPSPITGQMRRLITARLGRLTGAARALLSAGAVLGRRFTFDVGRRIAGLDEGDGLQALDELWGHRLLRREESDVGPSTYTFAHGKIREVAYTEAGDERRRIFHRRALTALEKKNTSPAELARHALAAGESEAAFRHSLAAGDAALDLYATREAVTHYEQARRLGEQISLNGEQWRRLYEQLGRAYELSGEYDQALATYEELEAIAQGADDRRLELAALMARATALVAPTGKGEAEATGTLLERTLALARELGDAAAESKTLWNLMLHVLFSDAAQAVAHGEASLAIARKHDLKRQMAHTLHDLQRAYMFTGRAEDGIEALLEAQDLWRELDDKAMLADNLANFAFYSFMGGNYDQGLAAAAEAQAHSEAIANLWGQSYSRIAPSFIYFDRGEYGQAITTMKRCIELGEAAGFAVPGGDVASVLALTYGLLGAFDDGFAWAERALANTEDALPDFVVAPLAARAHLHLLRGDLAAAETAVAACRQRRNPESASWGVPFSFLAEGELALAQGNYEEAIGIMDGLLNALRSQGIQPGVADALALKGRVLLAGEQWKEAEAALQEARETAASLQARRVLWPVLAALAELKEKQGHGETAVSLRQQAREIIELIADHIDDPDLREGFLGRTAVYTGLSDV